MLSSVVGAWTFAMSAFREEAGAAMTKTHSLAFFNWTSIVGR